MYKIFFIFLILLSTTSCSKNIKEKVGIVTSGPNEYKVQRGKPLEVPPHYDLPTPYQPYQTGINNKAHKENFNDGEQALIKELEDK